MRRYYGLSMSDLRGLGLGEAIDLVVHLPEDSVTFTAVAGGWTLANQLAAAQVDETRVLIWQKTKDGQKGRKAPKPIPRPGFEDTSSKNFTAKPVSIKEMQRRMDARRAPVPDDGLVDYRVHDGRMIRVTPKQAAYYSRNSR